MCLCLCNVAVGGKSPHTLEKQRKKPLLCNYTKPRKQQDYFFLFCFFFFLCGFVNFFFLFGSIFFFEEGERKADRTGQDT